MSKQSDAKAAQGYQPKPVPRTCVNCSHFAFDRKIIRAVTEWQKDFFEDKNQHCFIGDFAVKRSATCNLFDPLM